jgi:hypothetical protein
VSAQLVFIGDLLARALPAVERNGCLLRSPNGSTGGPLPTWAHTPSTIVSRANCAAFPESSGLGTRVVKWQGPFLG